MRSKLRETQWQSILLEGQRAVAKSPRAFAHFPSFEMENFEAGSTCEVGVIDTTPSRKLTGALDVEFRFAFTFRKQGRKDIFARVGYESKALLAMSGEVRECYIDPFADSQGCILQKMPAGETKRWTIAAVDARINPDKILARLMHPFQPIRVASFAALEWLHKKGKLNQELQAKAAPRIIACLRASFPDLERRQSVNTRTIKPQPEEPPAATAACFIAGIAGELHRQDSVHPKMEPFSTFLFKLLFDAYQESGSDHAEEVLDLQKFRYILKNPKELRPSLVLRALSTFKDPRVKAFVQANR